SICGLIFGPADDNSFPGGESVSFDHYRRAEPRELMLDVGIGSADRVVSGRNAMALQKLFCEGLARFKLCGRFRWAENRPSATRKLVHHPQLKRQLGSHNCQIRLELARQRDQRFQAFLVGWKTLGLLRNSAIPRRTINLLNAWRLAQLPHQCML